MAIIIRRHIYESRYLAIWMSLPIVVMAENWVGVEGEIISGSGIKGIYYVDIDSVSRKGDLAEIKVRPPGPDGARSDHVMTYRFDCVRDLKWNVDNPASKLAFDKACKRPWEFWK